MARNDVINEDGSLNINNIGEFHDRINTTNSELAQTQQQIATVLAVEFKTDVNDWGQAINDAINSVTTGKIVLPSGELVYSTNIIQKSGITIQGQGIDVTVLRPSGCHGISVNSGYFRFASIKDLTIRGDHARDIDPYDNTKNGVNWVSGVESYQCEISRVRVTNMAGVGVYVPYDFNNTYEEVFVSQCGGNGIEIAGLNTSTLSRCYVDYVATGKTGYRVYQNAVLISCNGLGGSGEVWGVFGRKNGVYEDTDNGVSQYNISFIQCNIEDWTKTGLKFLYSGSFNFNNTSFYAPKTGTFDYYIEADVVNRISIIDGLTRFESKGATANNSSVIRHNTSGAKILSMSQNITNYTTDGSTVYKLPVISSVYDSYLQEALEISYMNIKGMTYFTLGGKKHTHGTSFPLDGSANAGDIVYNTQPASGEYMGWICVTGGSPGTWKGFGLIEA